MNCRRPDVNFAPFSHFAKVMIIGAGAWAGAFSEPVYAGPGKAEVVKGKVSFDQQGNKWIIKASNGSIINYSSFNIGKGEVVKFIQPNELAKVLNRVTGNDPSVIAGKLKANGQVYIVNPAGVFFTNGAVVDTAGLFAAAGKISDAKFAAGKDNFTDLTGSVVNEGTIRANSVNLIGANVANHGTINAKGGLIVMVAGNEVILRQQGEQVMVKVDGKKLTNQNKPSHGSTTPDMLATPGVENTGTVSAPDGAVFLGAGDLYSLAIRNSGSVSAARGDVTVAAADGLIQNMAGGSISANATNATAGSVTVQGPSIVNSGSITADSQGGAAGSVEVTSQNHTYLTDGSIVSAAGGTGNATGGEVLVHSYNGETILSHDAVVDVSGGEKGGNAGFVEVSGEGLAFDGFADLSARKGFKRGTLLLDPFNLTISDTGSDDSLVSDGMIDFNEPDTTTDVTISDEALEAINGNIILQATGTITVAQQVDLVNNNNVTLQAYLDILFNQSINGMNNLTATADYDGNESGDLFVNAQLGILGNAVLGGNSIYLNNGGLTTLGSQEYMNKVFLGADTVLNAQEVRFHHRISGMVAGEQSLEIHAPTRFDAQVGVFQELESLLVDGATIMNGGFVKTKGFQEYGGPMTLTADHTLVSTGGGDIHFAGDVEGEQALAIQTAGLTRFEGTVGQNQHLTALTTDALGQTAFTGDVHAGYVDFFDDIQIDFYGGSGTITGYNWTNFYKTIEGNGNELDVNSPLTYFGGDVTNLAKLRTDADGVTQIAADITGDRVVFKDSIQLLSDSIITGHEMVDFDKTVNGAFNLTTNSDQQVRFGGDVGGEEALASLTTNVGDADLLDQNLVIIDGNLIRVTGDINFNPAGKSSPAQVATIAARNFGGILIESLAGKIFMGLNEKFTALGDMTLKAPNGTLTLGDLNTYGDLLLDSPDIYLYARGPGQILTSNGTLMNDAGASFVVFGTASSANPNATFHLLGTGNTPTFVSKVLENIQGPLGDFLTALFATLELANFTYQGVVLDLAAPHLPPVPPPPPGRPDTLFRALTDGPTQINDTVYREPFALRPMERLSIYVQAQTIDEIRGNVSGRRLSNDTPESLTKTRQAQNVTVTRLRRAQVVRALDRFNGVFEKSTTDAQTGAQTKQDQTPFIRESLSKAWNSYLNSEAAKSGGTLDPTHFRAFLAAQPDQAEALAYVDGLKGLFSELSVMGVTKPELRRSIDGLLGPIVPSGMKQSQLEEALQVNTLG